MMKLIFGKTAIRIQAKGIAFLRAHGEVIFRCLNCGGRIVLSYIKPHYLKVDK